MENKSPFQLNKMRIRFKLKEDGKEFKIRVPNSLLLNRFIINKMIRKVNKSIEEDNSNFRVPELRLDLSKNIKKIIKRHKKLNNGKFNFIKIETKDGEEINIDF